MRTLDLEATGTKWNISTYDVDLSSEIASEVVQRIRIFEETYSRFKPTSLISRMAKEPGAFELPGDARMLFDTYFKMYEVTEGRFTPLIGKALTEAGYDVNYSLDPKNITETKELKQVLTYNFPTLHLNEPAQMDLGAAGKGYLVDIVADLLISKGITQFTIDAGGDIFHSSYQKEIKVGLEHPEDAGKVIGIATLNNAALCASSGNRRKWKNFHHIIDPQSKASPTHILATWVTADHTITADAVSTALFLQDPKKLQEAFKFEYLILNNDLSVMSSEGFPAELFYA